MTVVIGAGCFEDTIDLLPSFLVGRETVVETMTPDELAEWQLVGKGDVAVDEENDALILTEGTGSGGVTLVSKKSYGRRMTLAFDVRPKSFEGVNFVFISASDKVTQGELKVVEDFRGDMEFWTDGRVQNYIFAFHNGFYESKPFIKKNPGLRDIAISRDVVESKNSCRVEVGRRGRYLWVKIDGKVVVSGRDKARGGLPGGRIGFRLRGPGAGSYACLYKNVVITEEK